MDIQTTLNKCFNEKLSEIIADELAEKGKFAGSLPHDNKTLLAVADAVNKLGEYVASVDICTLTIAKIKFVETSDKLYLRFGLLPENEESYNFITKEREQGVSVFELVNDRPVLNTLQLVESLTGRSDALAFYVTGDVVGTGFDGEPLLKNVRYVKRASIDALQWGIEALDANFSKREGNFDQKYKNMHLFYINGFEVCLGGYTYAKPKETFDVRMGRDRIWEDATK